MNDRVVEGRTTRRTQNAYGVRPDVEDRSKDLHLPDFAAFVLLAFPALLVPGLGLPANEIAPGALCALAAFRRPAVPAKLPTWFVLLVLAVPVWLALVSAHNDLAPYRRLLHLGLWAVLAIFVASGRIHLPSAARGLGVGLVLTVALTVAGLGPDTYVGRLSGTLGDPNLAGYVLTVLGCVAVGAGDRTWLRRVVAVVVAVAVVLTLSRTSLLAAVFAGAWVLTGRRVRPAFSIPIVAVYAYVVSTIPRETSLLGLFSDRTGSDALRDRLLAQEKVDVAASPWFGSGAGTAQVNLGSDRFFYHSSYLAAQREGGWVLIGILAVLAVTVFVSLLRMPVPRRNGWLEGAIICAAVVAVNLGEVLLELPAAIAIGAAMHHLLTARPPDPPPAPT
ncbi:hypothetical protein GCM10011519_27140 [Marmoricola endophyticus]|uniref:O-antigen ligase n=1 Tax=Marmoricola endophyticus TaxID=2040280 RepID=A0A917F639_9ACTN|nr:hypothetical protein [Marmoricola endophyticus]GGF51690.1 hypothetical protein GCM10011519_27140 [Marmoricola endophyticus]